MSEECKECKEVSMRSECKEVSMRSECKEVSMRSECKEVSIQSGQREGGKEVGRGGERNGKRNCGKVGRDKRRKGREGWKVKRVCCCHYNHSLISLYSVTISCYGNKIISILQVAGILSEAINSLQSASSIHPVLGHCSHVHMPPLTFACVYVCTNNRHVCQLQSRVDTDKNLAAPLDGRHGYENPMV